MYWDSYKLKFSKSNHLKPSKIKIIITKLGDEHSFIEKILSICLNNGGSGVDFYANEFQNYNVSLRIISDYGYPKSFYFKGEDLDIINNFSFDCDDSTGFRIIPSSSQWIIAVGFYLDYTESEWKEKERFTRKMKSLYDEYNYPGYHLDTNFIVKTSFDKTYHNIRFELNHDEKGYLVDKPFEFFVNITEKFLKEVI